MKISLKKQQGFLMIIAVLFIVVIGFLGVAIAYMFVGGSTSTLVLLLSNQAFYLAESGFEQGTHLLLTPEINNRQACSGLTINNTLGTGVYAVTGAGPFYISSPSTLNSAIDATATTIPVVSVTGYQASGRIMIDHELINYAAISGASFIAVTRGVDGSIASSHASGTRVGQFQCNLSSQGGAPSLSSSPLSGKRTLSETVQLEEGWVAGTNLSGSAWNIAHWNVPTEKQWTQQTISISSPQILKAVSAISNVDAWAVGNKATALHYNGSTWALVDTGIAGGDNLTSVSAVSSQEVWVCADQGKVYKWTPSTNWTNPFTPGDNPNSISMIDSNGTGIANAGWVVGAKKSANRYNGTTWVSATTGITVDLNSVSTLSETDAWAAGKAAVFQWNGTSWSGSSPTAATLNGISMIKSGSADKGWAVGTASTAIFFNGSSWTLQNTGLPGALTLNSVVTVSANEAWTVASTGAIYEWNGNSWNLIFTTSDALRGIDIVHPNGQPFSAWAEKFS